MPCQLVGLLGRIAFLGLFLVSDNPRATTRELSSVRDFHTSAKKVCQNNNGSEHTRKISLKLVPPENKVERLIGVLPFKLPAR